MAERKFADLDRWLLIKRCGEWFLDAPHVGPCRRLRFASWHPTFAEAHAAYLDAVTCDSTYDTGRFVGRGVVRCVLGRGHKGNWHECAHGGWRVDGCGAVFSRP